VETQSEIEETENKEPVEKEIDQNKEQEEEKEDTLPDGWSKEGKFYITPSGLRVEKVIQTVKKMSPSGLEIEVKETKWRRVRPEELVEELKKSHISNKTGQEKIGIDQKSVRMGQLHRASSIILTQKQPTTPRASEKRAPQAVNTPSKSPNSMLRRNQTMNPNTTFNQAGQYGQAQSDVETPTM
jgi:hypothetical protein